MSDNHDLTRPGGRRRPIRFECLEDRRLLSLSNVTTIAVGDFDNDGRDDLVIGKPLETVGYSTEAGLVDVIYGNSGGLGYNNRQTFHQDTPGVRGIVEQGDLFGSALAVGDFNGDGYDDLAIGSPGENIGSIVDGGVVNVLYGSRNGLQTAGDDYWYQGSDGVIGTAEADDKFGFSLAAGDFNRDGYDDLAIGVSEEDLFRNGNKITDAGSLNILYGRSGGLQTSDDQVWWQSRGIWGTIESYDQFGEVLAVGDFNRDGYDDLAVGVPRENWNSLNNSGVVQVIYGSANRLSGNGNEVWHQDSPGVWSSDEADDYFGRSLAVGDFNRDGYDDLAIGISDEDHSSTADAGAVQVIYGVNSGLSSANGRAFRQGRNGIANQAEDYDRFGRTLTVGDFNRDGYDDLAIGVPEENWNSLTNSGVVQVLYGRRTGLSAANDQLWHQDSNGLWSSDEAHDRFGSALAAGDFNGDGYDDLSIEVDGEGLFNDANHGAVNVVFGRSGGLNRANSQARWSRVFKIDVVLKDSNLNHGQQQTVFRAADRWAQIIVGDLPSYTVSGKGVVDDLVVEVTTKAIDGPSGTLASAGSRLLRSGSNLPATAEMTIDIADKGRSGLFGTVVHEFGHALGFVGWVVRRHGLFNSSETAFIGANAVAQYRAIFGNQATSVPMKKGQGHWSEAVFDDELMTPTSDPSEPLSRITIGAMRDLGYHVSYTFADAYSPP